MPLAVFSMNKKIIACMFAMPSISEKQAKILFREGGVVDEVAAALKTISEKTGMDEQEAAMRFAAMAFKQAKKALKK